MELGSALYFPFHVPSKTSSFFLLNNQTKLTLFNQNPEERASGNTHINLSTLKREDLYDPINTEQRLIKIPTKKSTQLLHRGSILEIDRGKQADLDRDQRSEIRDPLRVRTNETSFLSCVSCERERTDQTKSVINRFF